MHLRLGFLAPRYWPVWLARGLLWSVTRLPYAWQMRIGQWLGWAAGYLAKRRRHIAKVNLKLCFPELNDAERESLLRRHFVSVGKGMIEFALAWWGPDTKLRSLGRVEGLEYLQQALRRGKGVILLSAHFCSLEIGTRYLLMHQAVHGVYRPHENPLIEHMMHQIRETHVEKAIPRDAIREMIRSLKGNNPIWFAPDQNYGHKNSVFADFFGVPAATTTATARLARISGASVVPFFVRRLSHCQGYMVTLLPALKDFPATSERESAEQINQVIEEAVRKAPEQYLWIHRRFKDRPAGCEEVYS
ncbi:MAG: LpxL/LpxP family Kdo(2)-lipid IV(A) lauroyl/palmitoleoyl acyltransferase [Gammaproteobacteria bacterium]|nr:LpxL/LpxP family Kdo(2)-lipid IV(A) lauroyl/palmitoleoyl acyltransferase [Gammaproteobacteria bacterium]